MNDKELLNFASRLPRVTYQDGKLKNKKPNLNKFAKEVLEGNKVRGLHEIAMSDEELLMLVITELSNAVDAHRKGRMADLEMFQHSCEVWKKHYPDKENKLFVQDFEMYIKDTLEDELADSLLRLLDFSALRNIDLEPRHEDFFLSVVKKKCSFYYNIFSVIECLYSKAYCTELNVKNALKNIQKLAEDMNIDIWKYVSLKLEYNELEERLKRTK